MGLQLIFSILNSAFFTCFLLNKLRRSEASKAIYTRGTLDPICLEDTDASMGDWVYDLGIIGNDDLSWMDVTMPGERTSSNHRLQNTDDYNDATDDIGGDDGRGMDTNDDL